MAYNVVMRRRALVLAIANPWLASGPSGKDDANKSYTSVNETVLRRTKGCDCTNQSMCDAALLTWSGAWWIGMSKHNVGFPVMAHRVEVTAESMPPDTPTTKPSMAAASA